MSKFFLIDGMSLVFRAYHALSRSNLTSRDGEPTGAIFGFANTITSLIDKYNPKFITVVFDTAAPTFRHEMYEQYKANRVEFPEDLIPQLKNIKQLIELIGIKQIEMDGFEADDIIATMTTLTSKEAIDSYCLTSDKDYFQLVNKHTKILRPTRDSNGLEIVDYEQVMDKFGVKPDQVIDVQALMGDSVDNIPGVKGIGEKTAIPLIVEFGSIENLYENLDKVSSKSVRDKLENNKKEAFLSKELVTLKRDMKIEFKIEDYKSKDTNFDELDKLFENLGFRTLRKKWFEKSPKSKNISEDKIIEHISKESEDYDTIENSEKSYSLINDKKSFLELIDAIRNEKLLSFDLETSSLDKNHTDIVGIALATKPGKAFYISVISDKELAKINPKDKSLFEETEIDKDEFNRKLRAEKSLPIDFVIDKLKPILENDNIGKCGQNIKFDQYIIRRYGVNLNPIEFDSMLASYILDPDEKHNLDELSKKWLNYSPVSISTLIGEKKKTQKSMADLNPEDISEYACEDADLVLKLRDKMLPELKKEEKLFKLAKEIEFPLINVLNTMEMNGIAVDDAALKELDKEIAEKLKILEKEIYEEAGAEFNIDSPKQLSHILFEKLMIPPIKKTKSGYSTDVQVLQELASTYEIADYILEYRQLAKLSSTYVKSLPKMVNSATNRIHTTFNQTIASTGRLSSVDPNLQNIPIRTDMGKKVRKVFVPGIKDNIILSADYSQVELRIMAYISQDKKMIDSFKDNLDIHAATSTQLFGVKLDEVTADMRRIAKTVNFGIMYGLGAFGLAQRLGMSRTEAKEIIDNYKKEYPGIQEYMDITVKFAQENGYAETLLGRRRYFKNINNNNRMLKTADERAAINMPIQGTASDMMKIAMININRKMKDENYRSLMMLQVHDELVFEVYPDELNSLKDMVKNEMKNALSLGEVPVVVDTGEGINWFVAH